MVGGKQSRPAPALQHIVLSQGRLRKRVMCGWQGLVTGLEAIVTLMHEHAHVRHAGRQRLSAKGRERIIVHYGTCKRTRISCRTCGHAASASDVSRKALDIRVAGRT